MSGHTPGPWTVRAGSFPDDASEAMVVAYEIVMPKGPVISKANADLIAAAPDLLEALKRLIDPNNPEPWPVVEARARKAIAKAEGM